MSNAVDIIGLTRKNGRKVMVITSNIAWFETGEDGVTEVWLRGGCMLLVQEDMYTIVDMINDEEF